MNRKGWIPFFRNLIVSICCVVILVIISNLHLSPAREVEATPTGKEVCGSLLTTRESSSISFSDCFQEASMVVEAEAKIRHKKGYDRLHSATRFEEILETARTIYIGKSVQKLAEALEWPTE